MNQTIKIIPPPKQQTWVVPFQNESDRLDRQSHSSQSRVTSKETPCLVRTKSTIWVLSVIFFTGFTLIKCFECIHWYMDMPTYIHKRLVRDNVRNIALEKTTKRCFSIEDQQDVSIPGFTICPYGSAIAYNERILKMHGFESSKHYNWPLRYQKRLEDFSWKSNQSISPGEIECDYK